MGKARLAHAGAALAGGARQCHAEARSDGPGLARHRRLPLYEDMIRAAAALLFVPAGPASADMPSEMKALLTAYGVPLVGEGR